MREARKDYQVSTKENEEGENDEFNYSDHEEQLEEEYYNNYYIDKLPDKKNDLT